MKGLTKCHDKVGPKKLHLARFAHSTTKVICWHFTYIHCDDPRLGKSGELKFHNTNYRATFHFSLLLRSLSSSFYSTFLSMI